MMSLSHDQLLALLEERFDYHSARAALAGALTRTGISWANRYDANQLRKLVMAIQGHTSRAETLLARMLSIIEPVPHQVLTLATKPDASSQ